MPTTKSYLLLYNLVSLALWATLTSRLFLLLPALTSHPSLSLSHLHEALFPLLQFTQSLAVLEIIHSLLGLVKAPVMTTGMQVASRLLVVWGVLAMFPEVVVGRDSDFAGGWLGGWIGGLGGGFRKRKVGKGGELAELGCLTAWGVTECVRYGYFVYNLRGYGVPAWLKWLR
jgi:very-long-chain (3R)-3-hydroxyacyl-CoA dehydratase